MCETVLGDALARITFEPHHRCHHSVTVVAYQAAAVGAYPQESIGINEDGADIVMGKSAFQVDIRHIIPLCQHDTLCHTSNCPP